MSNVYEECCCLQCGECQHFQVDADRRETTTCKRLDHKKYKFAVPWFKSYDCGQYSQTICSDFIPVKWSVWLYSHWTNIEDWIAGYEKEEHKSFFDKQYVALCIDGDTSVRYYVNKKDYFYNCFIDERGELKWIKRCYYKQSRKSPIGYQLVWEYNKDE